MNEKIGKWMNRLAKLSTMTEFMVVMIVAAALVSRGYGLL